MDRNQRDGESSSPNSSREIEMTVALAEHLLGQLSPGQLYVIDSSFKSNGKCSCGEDNCKSSPKYGSNGIGKNILKNLILAGIRYKINQSKTSANFLCTINCNMYGTATRRSLIQIFTD